MKKPDRIDRWGMGVIAVVIVAAGLASLIVLHHTSGPDRLAVGHITTTTVPLPGATSTTTLPGTHSRAASAGPATKAAAPGTASSTTPVTTLASPFLPSAQITTSAETDPSATPTTEQPASSSPRSTTTTTATFPVGILPDPGKPVVTTTTTAPPGVVKAPAPPVVTTTTTTATTLPPPILTVIVEETSVGCWQYNACSLSVMFTGSGFPANFTGTPTSTLNGAVLPDAEPATVAPDGTVTDNNAGETPPFPTDELTAGSGVPLTGTITVTFDGVTASYDLATQGYNGGQGDLS